MERTKARPLVAVPYDSTFKAQGQAQAQPQAASKLRKRLQKSATKQRKTSGPAITIKERPMSDAFSDQAVSSSDNQPETVKSRRTIAVHFKAKKQQQQLLQEPCLLPTLTPDLNDSKWSDYLLRETGCFCPKTSTTRESSLLLPQPKESPDLPLHQPQPAQIIPELSHLAISNANTDTGSSSESQDSSTPIAMNRRRRAKTPIFSIGQLENIPRPANALASAEKRSSAEDMAEQYRVLIASRNSILIETRSEPSQSRQGHRYDDAIKQHPNLDHRQNHGDLLPPEIPLPRPNGSPTTTSDDGTLVGFEEETVYFKPVSSLSPDPSSPEQRFFASPLPEQIPGNLSLQICLDLLTRDLSSGLKGAELSATKGDSNNDNAGNTSALQIWVMIEAYERLRDQLFSEADSGRLGHIAGLGLEEIGAMGMMMDMWLRALYTIHDGLVGRHGDGNESVSEYELGMEELD